MSGIDTLYLFVPLVPMGKERPRARSIPGRGGGKGFTNIYTPAKTKKWEITGASSIKDQLRDMGSGDVLRRPGRNRCRRLLS